MQSYLVNYSLDKYHYDSTEKIVKAVWGNLQLLSDSHLLCYKLTHTVEIICALKQNLIPTNIYNARTTLQSHKVGDHIGLV
jgi:hypothetical protein